MCGKIGWLFGKNFMEFFWEQSGAQIRCKVCWNNWNTKFDGKIGGQFGDKLGEQFLFNIHDENLLKNVEQKLAGKIRWNNMVEKLSGKSIQCAVYSVQ